MLRRSLLPGHRHSSHRSSRLVSPGFRHGPVEPAPYLQVERETGEFDTSDVFLEAGGWELGAAPSAKALRHRPAGFRRSHPVGDFAINLQPAGQERGSLRDVGVSEDSEVVRALAMGSRRRMQDDALPFRRAGPRTCRSRPSSPLPTIVILPDRRSGATARTRALAAPRTPASTRASYPPPSPTLHVMKRVVVAEAAEILFERAAAPIERFDYQHCAISPLVAFQRLLVPQTGIPCGDPRADRRQFRAGVARRKGIESP